MGQIQLESNQKILGNYTFSKQESDFSIFKNNVYGTVSPPVWIPSGWEGRMSRGEHCCHTRVRNEEGMVLMGPKCSSGTSWLISAGNSRFVAEWHFYLLFLPELGLNVPDSFSCLGSDVY